MMADSGVNPDPFSQFAEFVVENKRAGRDITGKTKDYVPFEALTKHWTIRRIVEVLNAFSPRLEANPRLIQDHYLRVFSTLVSVGPDAVRNLRKQFISRELSDAKLPRSSMRGEWPETKFHSDLFKTICPHQWQFFPLEFAQVGLQDRILGPEYILPIDDPIVIAPGSIADVQRVVIHDSYNKLVPKRDDVPVERTFVFKVYHNKDYESYYENEWGALMRLNNSPSPNLVKCYGSFRQQDHCCVVLEYVDGGDLHKFFERESPPETDKEVAMFWKSLFQVFNGLDKIHQLMQYDGQLIQGIHEDITPDNILLMRGSSGSPYDFTPKLADFGLFSRVRTFKRSPSGKQLGFDHRGNQQYSSPECSHHTPQRQKRTNLITPEADIFSIGAVLSHTSAWVAGGPGLQTEYWEIRKAYHEKKLPRFVGGAYEGCFHDSIGPLPVIRETHRQLILQRCRRFDDITPVVLDLVEKSMLLGPAKNRWPAENILEKFESALLIPQSPLPSPTMATPTFELPLSTTTSGLTVSPSPLFSPGVPSPSTVDGVSVRSAITPQPSAKPTSSITPEQDQRPPLVPTWQVNAGPSGSLPILRDDSKLTVETASSAHPATNTDRSSEYTALSSVSSSQHPVNEAPACLTCTTSPVITDAADRFKNIKVADVKGFHAASKNGTPAEKETQELVNYLRLNLGGRDQLFFIDDSSGMGEYHDTISEGFLALSCIAKRLDPDKVELVFASQPRKVFKARKTTRLYKLVKAHEYRGHRQLMENKFGVLIDRVIIPYLPLKFFGINVNPRARKQLSVYIFTDGNWGEGQQSVGLQRPIRRLMEELKKRNLDRTQVSLHFVRFGHKENGKRLLDRLDSFGQQDDCDIVDVKHIRGSVAAMVWGPLDRENDDMRERPSADIAA